LGVTGKLRGKTSIVPHGLNPRFNQMPKLQQPISDYSETHPYRIIYVSTIDQYKHQWNVVEAVAALRKEGFPIVLDLVGPAYPPALDKLNKSINLLDPERTWVKVGGAVPFEVLHDQYTKADLGIFASSCENMPNILLETMASGLPIACSNRGPMPEILGDAGIYFDPEKPSEIICALRKMIESPKLRAEFANLSHSYSVEYSWQRCADSTFEFLASFARQSKEYDLNFIGH
jgi:glycosyltransferase involved in cell wall biosynthesis